MNYLNCLEYLGFGLEQAHLKERTLEEKEQRLIEAKSLKDKGWTNVKIANHFNVSEEKRNKSCRG